MAGFAGIVAAIRHRDISRWAHHERIMLQMLLVASGMAVSFALLPAVLGEAQLAESTIWRVGSISYIVWQFGISVHRSRQFRAAGVRPPLPRFVYAWITIIVALQALNIVLGASWPYLLGVFGILVNAFTFFWVLLLGGDGKQGAAA